ncbi:MAG TPA: Na/Pi cotransporter family protein [Candidatus Treponema faecavium]|nr:Na/Pi cotransporter family protein [Candidatus Treponema faecavium]
MNAANFIFQLIGSLGFLLYGMKMMSDGIQKSAGESLHRVLGLMTGNRVFAVLTGLFITMIIQSSSATTVMVVSFVNAGLLTLKQSIGVIFGANIGTTITAWIVSLFGFNFDISLFAIPVFGIGYFLTFIKRIHKETIGEAFMGFGLLFLGLDLLSSTMPEMSADNMSFLAQFTDNGALSIGIGILAGLILTVLIHSSSASTAIILTMSYNKMLPWEFAAAMVLGSNIGTTIDAVLAAIGTKVNARRAALIHVLFNVAGTVLAVIFFHPLLALVDMLVPGPVEDSITTHIAMLHTVFNLSNTIIFLPFTTQIARLTERLIKPKSDETPDVYHLDFTDPGLKGNAAAYLMRAEKEIADMTEVVARMFSRINDGINNRTKAFLDQHMQELAKEESYADQMKEGISNFLVHCMDLPINDKQRANISDMLRIVDDLESMTDDCYTVALLLQRSIDKHMSFAQEDMERLNPYVDLAKQFVHFIKDNINKHFDEERLRQAQNLEDQIDLFRKNLKRVARKRLEKGADVKSELLYIDLVRNIEKIGDRAFSISETLFRT